MQARAYSICETYNVSIRDHTVYRVKFSDGKENVEIVCFGMECLDTSVTGQYINIRETPKWLQRKVATLMLLDPPSRNVDGVGRRRDKDTYWVYND